MRTCTRWLEFDAAHRVMEHESKCRNLHGHRYRVGVTCGVQALDPLGRVIDFGLVKQVFGRWVDDVLDHGAILNAEDRGLAEFCRLEGWRLFTMAGNPTAENLASLLYFRAREMLEPLAVRVVRVVVYETPACCAEFCAEDVA